MLLSITSVLKEFCFLPEPNIPKEPTCEKISTLLSVYEETLQASDVKSNVRSMSMRIHDVA